jgi:hypothetical protein
MIRDLIQVNGILMPWFYSKNIDLIICKKFAMPVALMAVI